MTKTTATVIVGPLMSGAEAKAIRAALVEAELAAPEPEDERAAREGVLDTAARALASAVREIPDEAIVIRLEAEIDRLLATAARPFLPPRGAGADEAPDPVRITVAACAFAKAADHIRWPRGLHREAWAVACAAMAAADAVDAAAHGVIPEMPASAINRQPGHGPLYGYAADRPRVRWGRLRPVDRARHVRTVALRPAEDISVDKLLDLAEDIRWPERPLRWIEDQNAIRDLAIATAAGRGAADTSATMAGAVATILPADPAAPSWRIDFGTGTGAARIPALLAEIGVEVEGPHGPRGPLLREQARGIVRAWRGESVAHGIGAVRPEAVATEGTILDIGDPRTPGAVKALGGCSDVAFAPEGAEIGTVASRCTALDGRRVDLHLWRGSRVVLRLAAHATADLPERLARLGIESNEQREHDVSLARAVREGWGVV